MENLSHITSGNLPVSKIRDEERRRNRRRKNDTNILWSVVRAAGLTFD